jgi:hypothetical protein
MTTMLPPNGIPKIVEITGETRIVFVTKKCGPVSPDEITKVERILSRMAGHVVRVTAISPSMASFYEPEGKVR